LSIDSGLDGFDGLDALETSDEGAPWQVVFLNLMLVLLAMFIAMVSARYFKKTEAKPPKVASVKKISEMEKKKNEALALRARLVKALRINDADIDIYQGQPRIVLSAQVTFRSGQATLTSMAKAQLGRISEMLKGTDKTILVEGHTDDRPIHTRRYQSNWELSAARALAVVQLFVARGIPETRLELVGYGAFRPRQANTLAEGREKNRRIEIKLR